MVRPIQDAVCVTQEGRKLFGVDVGIRGSSALYEALLPCFVMTSDFGQITCGALGVALTANCI